MAVKRSRARRGSTEQRLAARRRMRRFEKSGVLVKRGGAWGISVVAAPRRAGLRPEAGGSRLVKMPPLRERCEIQPVEGGDYTGDRRAAKAAAAPKFETAMLLRERAMLADFCRIGLTGTCNLCRGHAESTGIRTGSSQVTLGTRRSVDPSRVGRPEVPAIRAGRRRMRYARTLRAA